MPHDERDPPPGLAGRHRGTRRHGEYRYEGGWNVNALIATGIGSIFSTILPNFTNLLPAWWNTYGWFFGVAIGGTVYFVMAMLRPRAAVAPVAAR